ncbi:hypothetical protein FHR34_005511 [Kitasatospora kifunensis]|uniref:Uncharacterized protein n=1 Tax=Kitasatospora kifunensis TaxID=58351 RepID=A0A7W7VXZ7_KITKI|nr:hypothetical protein [Kitasatospora kifunensis]
MMLGSKTLISVARASWAAWSGKPSKSAEFLIPHHITSSVAPVPSAASADCANRRVGNLRAVSTPEMWVCE